MPDIHQSAMRPSYKDLDRVFLTAAVVSDDGDEIARGTEGTIVSVHEGAASYVVEFPEPVGALATVEPHEISSPTPKRGKVR